MLGEIPPRSRRAGFDVERMRLVERRDYEIDVQLEGLRRQLPRGLPPPVVHPGLLQELDYDAYRVEPLRYYSMQHAPLRRAEAGRAARRDRRYLRSPDAEDAALYYWVFPNLMLNLYPDNMQTNVILPLGADRTLTIFEWFVADPAPADAAAESMRETIAFSDEIQQRGHRDLRGGAARPALARLRPRPLLGEARERRAPLPEPRPRVPRRMTTRADGKLTVALISEVFWQADGTQRLRERLAEAADRGADLAVLPEIPLHPWRPATKDAHDEDAEPMDGPRAMAQREAAKEAGIGLVGGIIHRAEDGRRTSRALVIDGTGEVRATYEKLHLPEEPGFWETSHYEPGTEAPRRIDAFGVPIGVQICSDNNRPEGTHLLGAQGAMAVLVPRASEEKTYQRWKTVFRSNALTGCVYVLSVNRPDPEDGVLIGGPSVAIDPSGFALVETTDRMTLVTLDATTVTDARRNYPGYLPVRARLYADAWAEVAGTDG